MDYSTLLPQIKSLHAQVPKSRVLKALIQTLYKSKKSIAYSYLTLLLWEYIAEELPDHLCHIPEPIFNPSAAVRWKKRYISHELACAILDFHAITHKISTSNVQTVLAIGANAWQLGYVFLHQIPLLKYIVTDSSFALQRVQGHYEKVFPNKKIFLYRPFENFESVKQEFESASICLIEPCQLPLLPPRSVDLGITIDVLDKLSHQEMGNYFELLAKLIKGYFYFKEQKNSSIKEADYQLPEEWEEIFWRTCILHPFSFEALFAQGTIIDQ
jgi:putative sugar O-methyltransferase